VTQLNEKVLDALYAGELSDAQQYVSQGANVDASDAEGNPLLYQTAMSGNFEIAAFLLENGADPEIRGSGGVSPLMMAAYSGYTPIVALLLKHGAKAEGRSDDGWDMEDWVDASDYQTQEIRALLANPGLAVAYVPPADFLREWNDD